MHCVLGLQLVDKEPAAGGASVTSSCDVTSSPTDTGKYVEPSYRQLSLTGETSW